MHKLHICVDATNALTANQHYPFANQNEEIKDFNYVCKLPQTQFVLLAALAWLSKQRKAVTQVDIANQSNADRMMVSKVLRTLEDKGFITR